MPEDVEDTGGEVSDALSENEYDDTDLHLDDDLDDKMSDAKVKPETGVDDNGDVKKKYDPKDPLRPRRKKARRACYACQRAHLTCGDERPCGRCIKRGLQDQCQDGVRKKAKYLHDAPPEALRPVLGPNYNPSPPQRPNGHRHPSSTASDVSSSFFSQPTTANSTYPVFPPGQNPTVTLPDSMSFQGQQSPVSPTFQASSQMGSLSMSQVPSEMPTFSQPLFDPSNPALFNFNLEGLNFGSQYAAMEFGMLGHMTGGLPDTPSQEQPMGQQQQGTGGSRFASSNAYGNGTQQLYESGMMGDFLGLDSTANGFYSQGNLQHGLPHAYAIQAGPTSLQSPSTENNSPQPTSFGFEGSPSTASFSGSGNSSGQTIPQPPRPKSKQAAKPGLQSILGKRQRDPSTVYDEVKEPYKYVSGFHRLIALLQKRFSNAKILQIAKSLSSIRPSFISCTKTLNRQDLIFMEKSFQRTLFEYEDFMIQASSPTIVCRRTGEIAAVNKEFTMLTGWTKDVLLGKEPNLNVNTGTLGAGSNSNDGSGRGGLTTPRLRTLNAEQLQATDGKPQPVFIAELMDDDSVIEFYDDYASLAFGDSRGRAEKKCRLLKYRTQETLDGSAAGSVVSDQTPRKEPSASILSHRVARIDGEHGISRIEKNGKLECTYCWYIRRDMFDIPMMIVMNFLPCYYPNEQLAV